MTELREEVLDEESSDLTEEEKEAQRLSEVRLSDSGQKFIDSIIDKLMLVCDQVGGDPLYPYQAPCARRIFESLLIGDGKLITAIFSRQSGKSELVADVVVTCMIMFPILAKMYPEWFGKFRKGIWVGAFAPVDDQAETLYSRIREKLTSDTTRELLADPEINLRIIPHGKLLPAQ